MSDDNQIDSLTVNVGLDTGGFKRGQQEVDAGLDQLEQGAKEATDSVNDLGEAASTTGNNLGDLGGKTNEASSQIDELGHSSSHAAHKIKALKEQIEELKEDAEDAAGDIADLQDELDNLTQSSGKTGRTMGSHFDQVTRSVRGLANEVMGLMALNKMASGGYGNAAGQAIEKDTAINRQAESIGISPSRLNAWGNATELEGGTVEEGRNFLQRINDAFVGHTIDARQIPELLLKNVNSRNPDGSQRAVNDMALDTLDVLLNKADERQRSLIIRDFFGGGAGLTRLAGMGRDGVEQSLLKAEHRANLSNQDFQNIDQFSRALREAGQNVEGFGNGLLSWTAKMFGPTLEQLNKDHPELVGAGGAAATAGIVAGGWLGIKRLVGGTISKSIEEAVKKSGLAAAESAVAGAEVGAGAEAGVALISRLALVAKAANIAGVVYYGSKPIQTAGPEIDTLSGAGVIAPMPERPRDRWDDLNYLQQGKIKERIEARDKGNIPAEWKYSQKWKEQDESIWEEHQKNLDEYRKDAAAHLGIPADVQVPMGRPHDRWDGLNSWQQDAITERIKSRDSGKVPEPWQGNETQRSYDESLYAEHQKNIEDYQKRVDAFQKKMALTNSSFKRAAAPTQTPLASAASPHSFEEMQQRIVYQESRGQDYWRSGKQKGQPVVSAVGARYSRQVMPATAHDPGFGIPPARNESPEEYNRVGDALMKALYSYYNGDTDKAMAAYHSGMGRVNKLVANAGRNGTDWRQGLGPKGRAYIGFDSQQVPQHLLSMNDPANYPGVQQAMIRNDNRRITNTTHIDTLQVTTAGGSPEAMASGAQSALQRHPLALNGSDYA